MTCLTQADRGKPEWESINDSKCAVDSLRPNKCSKSSLSDFYATLYAHSSPHSDTGKT